jgi:hypothetical protein
LLVVVTLLAGPLPEQAGGQEDHAQPGNAANIAAPADRQDSQVGGDEEPGEDQQEQSDAHADDVPSALDPEEVLEDPRLYRRSEEPTESDQAGPAADAEVGHALAPAAFSTTSPPPAGSVCPELPGPTVQQTHEVATDAAGLQPPQPPCEATLAAPASAAQGTSVLPQTDKLPVWVGLREAAADCLLAALAALWLTGRPKGARKETAS